MKSVRQVPSRILDRFRTNHFVGGSYVPGVTHTGAREPIQPVCPINEDHLPPCVNGNRGDVTQAVASATEGFQKWKQVPNKERANLLRRIAESLDKHKESFAE